MDGKSGIEFQYMDILGLWSWFTNRSKLSRLILFYNFFYLVYQFFYLSVLQSARLSIDRYELELEVMVEKLQVICIDFQPCFKIIFLLTMEKPMIELIQIYRRDFLHCSIISSERTVRIIQSSESFCNKVMYLIFIMVLATLGGYQLAPVAECMLSDCKYLKTIPDWHPFDESLQPAKTISFLLDSGSLWFTCLFECSVMLLVFSVGCVFGAQMDVLADCIERIGQEEIVELEVGAGEKAGIGRWRLQEKEEVGARQKKEVPDLEVGTRKEARVDALVDVCLKSHQQMLRIAELMERIFSLLNLFQMLLSTIMICTCGFMLMISLVNSTKEEISANPVQSVIRISKYLCFFSSMILQLTIFSFTGFIVTDKTSNLQQVFYKCNWSIMTEKTKKKIAIAMARANKPSTITAGKFYVVSLESYAAIMRASYTYFAMLYRLTSSK